jgi:hypothetical protein
MSRGRPKLEPVELITSTYTRVFLGEDCDTTWYFDTDITTSGPVRVDVKWHKTMKQIESEGKAHKDLKKQQRVNTKFFKLKDEQKQGSGSSSGKSRGRPKKS